MSSSPPPARRHHPQSVAQRLSAVLVVCAAVILVVGSLVWRLVFVYSEYKVGAGVVSNDAGAARGALHTLAVMRGIGLVVFGVLLLVFAALEYFRERPDRRRWTGRDTLEVLGGIACVGIGAFLFTHDQYALVGLRS